MRIGPADTERQVAIVAELGNNHEGSMELARELVAAAAEAGAHAVKFQAIDPPKLVRPSEAARLEQLERFRLRPDEHAELAQLARSLRIGYLCTPFDLDTVDWLAPLVDAIKIASGDNDFHPLIAHAAKTGRPLIISTGMSDDEVVGRALATAAAAGATEVALLHCIAAYPTATDRAMIATIPALAARHGVAVGFSDHTLGIEAALVAVAAGARILEKHVTLDHDQSDFRDHQLSLEPDELRELVRRVAEVEAIRGAPRADVMPEEEATHHAARRSIVAARDLPAGHVIDRSDLTWLRPRDGLPPGEERQVVGRTLARALERGEPVLVGDLR
jgi:N,N'-diacetyllegionaminate synthase